MSLYFSLTLATSIKIHGQVISDSVHGVLLYPHIYFGFSTRICHCVFGYMTPQRAKIQMFSSAFHRFLIRPLPIHIHFVSFIINSPETWLFCSLSIVIREVGSSFTDDQLQEETHHLHLHLLFSNHSLSCWRSQLLRPTDPCLARFTVCARGWKNEPENLFVCVFVCLFFILFFAALQ